MNMMALKLDASYRPIELIDALEALVMCIVGKATPVETYNTKIRSPSISLKFKSLVKISFDLTLDSLRFIGILG